MDSGAKWSGTPKDKCFSDALPPMVIVTNSLRKHYRKQRLSKQAKNMSIGEAAEKAGISRQSLQYYLMVGLLEPTEVTSGGRRLFDDKAVERIRLIKRLNKTGYPLRAIRELFMEGRTDMKGH
jgi:predicted transcriptional regulator